MLHNDRPTDRPFGHSHHTEGKGHGHTDGQTLRNSRHSQGHPDIEHVDQFLALPTVKEDMTEIVKAEVRIVATVSRNIMVE